MSITIRKIHTKTARVHPPVMEVSVAFSVQDEIYKGVFLKQSEQSQRLRDLKDVLYWYVEKTDVFIYRELVEWNAVTSGVIEELELIQQDKALTNSSYDCYLDYLIKALDLFWY